MKFTKGPVALVVLALAAEMAYIVIKGSREVAKAKPHNDNKDRPGQKASGIYKYQPQVGK